MAEVQSKKEFYKELVAEASSLVDGEVDVIANMANISSVVYHALNRRTANSTNWVGFYVARQPELLILGPFHGQPACLRIPFGKGVCGTSAKSQKTLIVPDVHKFEGHIACDSASNSEIVIPIVSKSGNVVGVFDLDSPNLEQFDDEDRVGLEQIVASLVKNSVWDICHHAK